MAEKNTEIIRAINNLNSNEALKIGICRESHGTDEGPLFHAYMEIEGKEVYLTAHCCELSFAVDLSDKLNKIGVERVILSPLNIKKHQKNYSVSKSDLDLLRGLLSRNGIQTEIDLEHLTLNKFY
ncbi:MAG: hypothetical protein AABX30_01250 [Nanoarchaeota archaeon]